MNTENPDFTRFISKEEHEKILAEVAADLAAKGPAATPEVLPVDEDVQSDEDYELNGPRTFAPTPEQAKKLMEQIRQDQEGK